MSSMGMSAGRANYSQTDPNHPGVLLEGIGSSLEQVVDHVLQSLGDCVVQALQRPSTGKAQLESRSTMRAAHVLTFRVASR